MPTAQERHGERMNAQQPVADRERGRGGDDADDRERDEVGVELDDVDDAVDLAARLPPDGAGEVERRAGEQQGRGRHEGEPRRSEVKQRRRPDAPVPQAQQLVGQQADAVDAERRQVAEEQSDREDRRYREPQRPRPLPQPDPHRHRPQRQADPEHVVHQADQEDVVVQQRQRDERQDRPAPDQRPVERQRAGHDQREHRDGENLTGDINGGGELAEQRHDQIHRQVRDDLPVDLVKPRQVGVVPHGGDDVHPRQVIDVVRQRRQRVRPHRDRDQERQRDEQHRDLHAGEVRRRPTDSRPIGVVDGEYGHWLRSLMSAERRAGPHRRHHATAIDPEFVRCPHLPGPK